MSRTRKPKTILVTFAGRQDRMELLTRYVDLAIEAGLIDEWHVWDFSRNAADAQWLRQTFPVTQVTPSNSLEYFALPRKTEITQRRKIIRFEVCAASDIHIGLRRTAGIGQSYEIVLGGWQNQSSAIRLFDDPQQLTDVAARDPLQHAHVVSRTSNLLPEFGFVAVDIELGPEGMRICVEGREVLRETQAVQPGAFDILYRTGYGSNGEWRFPETEAANARLFVSGPAAHYPANSMFYTNAYQYYAANRDRYYDDVFLKCDDDIVYFDIAQLRDFVAFRRRNPQFFLVSANVVNNGVCAHFQQASGAIPAEFGELEMPQGGMCGSLWASGDKAERLHSLFLKDPSAFTSARHAPIPWRERISINFVAWLGADLVHIPDIMSDDEHDLCYGVRKRARKANCIYPAFVASHLSFWKQDADMNTASVITNYQTLAARELSAFSFLEPTRHESAA